MVSLFLLLGCNLSHIVDLFASLHELASASTRTLLKLASSVRALLKPYGDTLKKEIERFCSFFGCPCVITEEYSLKIWVGYVWHADQNMGFSSPYLRPAVEGLICNHWCNEDRWCQTISLYSIPDQTLPMDCFYSHEHFGGSNSKC